MIDSNHPSVPSLALELGGQDLEPSDRAVRFFLFVRDEICYDPCTPLDLPHHYRASSLLERKRAFSAPKASLLRDLRRASGIDRVILELKSQGMSILLAEQNLKSALKLADYGSRIEHIREGS